MAMARYHRETAVDYALQPQPRATRCTATYYNALPYGYANVHYHGSPYYYHGGAWYRPYGPRYVVVAPPIGIGIGWLPPYYTTVWFGGAPYYYADHTYYQWYPERREYVVTQPPEQQQATVGDSPSSRRGSLRLSEERPERGAAVHRSLRVPRLGRAAERLRSHAPERRRGRERGIDERGGRVSANAEGACLETVRTAMMRPALHIVERTRLTA